MTRKLIVLQFSLLFLYNFSLAQEIVPIINYSVNNSGQALLSIEAEEGKYYVLSSQHSPTFEWATAVNMGVDGTMIISDPGGAYPIENYTITEYDISSPGDLDGDQIDDVTEYNNMPTDAPINFAQAIDFEDGAITKRQSQPTEPLSPKEIRKRNNVEAVFFQQKTISWFYQACH